MSDYLSPNFHDRSFLFDIKRTGVDLDLYTTTEDIGVVYTWKTIFMGLKYFKITAGFNDVIIRVEVSFNGENWDELLPAYPDTTVTAGTTSHFDVSTYAPLMRILARDAVSGDHGTVTVELVATNYGFQDRGSYAIGYEQINVTTNAIVALDDKLKHLANSALLTIETNPVRARWDGGNPTTTLGHMFRVGDTVQITSPQDMISFKAISAGGTSQLNVTYSR